MILEKWCVKTFPNCLLLVHRKWKWTWKWSSSVTSDSLRPPWTVAYQAPPSMEFPRQGYWSGLPFPSPMIFLTQGLNTGLPLCRQMFLSSEPPGKPLVYRRMILLYFSRIIKEGEEEKEAFLNMTCKSCLLLSRLANLFYKHPYSKYFSARKSCSGTPPSLPPPLL